MTTKAVTSASRVAVALGSNLGDRRKHLEAAVTAIAAFIDSIRVSGWYETAPVGVGLQPDFLNGAATGVTTLTANALLERLLDAEATLGRERPFPGAPRTVDLDLILYGSEVIDQPPALIVPHPRFRERKFVLEPLAEIASEWVDPVTGLTVGRLLARLDSRDSQPREQP